MFQRNPAAGLVFDQIMDHLPKAVAVVKPSHGFVDINATKVVLSKDMSQEQEWIGKVSVK